MAIFTATNSATNVMLLFGWVDDGTPIDVINIENGPGVGPASRTSTRTSTSATMSNTRAMHRPHSLKT